MQEAIDATLTPVNDLARPYIRHSKRQNWGRAMFLWEREGKRGYQFEDGDMRVFAEAYYHFLQPAVAIDAEIRVRLEQLALKNGHLDTDVKGGGKKKSTGPKPEMVDQIALFLELFPGGFAGSTWRATHRGEGSKRRVKRHRDPALTMGAKLLNAEAMRHLLDSGMYDEVRTRMVEAMGPTNLVTKKQLGALEEIVFTERVAVAMVEFLHGEGDEGTRFRTLRRALATLGLKAPAWPLLTGVLSLAHPSEHVCVRPSVFEKQAKLARIGGKRTRKMNVDAYSTYRAMAKSIRDELAARGHEPQDMFDVHDFIWVTLRPGAKEGLEAAMIARLDAAPVIPPVEPEVAATEPEVAATEPAVADPEAA